MSDIDILSQIACHIFESKSGFEQIVAENRLQTPSKQKMGGNSSQITRQTKGKSMTQMGSKIGRLGASMKPNGQSKAKFKEKSEL